MSAKLVLKFALAFCLALAVGRLLFPTTPAAKRTAGATSSHLPAVNVAAAASGEQARSAATPAQASVVREFKAVDGGMLNENVRLSHFISNIYTEGTLHKAPRQFGASVQWEPLAQELCRDQQVVAAVKAAPARATVEQADKYNCVVFPATYPDTDERMYVRPDGGVEHDIVLQRALEGIDGSYALAYTGCLRLSQGMTLWDGERQIEGPYRTQKCVQIKNELGNTVFCLRPPVAWDASVAARDGRSLDAEKQAVKPQALTACEYRFEFDAAGINLAVVTPGRWLADAARAYPVTIDPNLGPFGLADGDPPNYVGTVGSDTLLPANSGGQQLVMAADAHGGAGVGHIVMPFAFTYDGHTYAAHDDHHPLNVYSSGALNWVRT